MKGDYHRYLAEFKVGSEQKEAAEDTMLAYKAAQDIALADLAPTHPIREVNEHWPLYDCEQCIIQKRIDDVEERFEAERAKRATERAYMVAEREVERAKIVANKADFEHRINKWVHQEFEKLFTSRMQQLFGMHSGLASTYSQSQPRDEP